MTMEEERTDRSPNTTDVRVRVPRRAAAWGAKTCWARHAIQAVVIAVVGWQAVGHVTSGGESAEAWCPLGGIEGAWTVLTTGRTVAHGHTSSLVLAGMVLVLARVGRGFFCGWLCPLGTLQEMVHKAGRAVTDRIPRLRRLRHRLERQTSWGKLRAAVYSASTTKSMVKAAVSRSGRTRVARRPPNRLPTIAARVNTPMRVQSRWTPCPIRDSSAEVLLIAITSSEVPTATGIVNPRARTSAGTTTKPPPTPKNPVSSPTADVSYTTFRTRRQLHASLGRNCRTGPSSEPASTSPPGSAPRRGRRRKTIIAATTSMR